VDDALRIPVGEPDMQSPTTEEQMMLASSYPFLDVVWTMFIFFAWVIWIWFLITILADVFRRHDLSGFGKAMWTIFLIFLPFLGALIYLISQGSAMAQRNAEQAQAYQSQTEDYIKSVASEGDPSEQIARGKQLLDSGAISADEFAQLKAKALAT
jgi:predicted PurR-regulated permease PerM